MTRYQVLYPRNGMVPSLTGSVALISRNPSLTATARIDAAGIYVTSRWARKVPGAYSPASQERSPSGTEVVSSRPALPGGRRATTRTSNPVEMH